MLGAHTMSALSHEAAAGWFEARHPAELLYGAIVSAAVLATATHAEGSQRVAVVTAVVLVIYWCGHVYINALSRQFEGDDRRMLLRLRAATVHEIGVLLGGVPAIVVYVLAALAGAGASTAATVAVYFSIALLAGVGYLGARRAGLGGWAMLLETAGAATFGILIVTLKTLLH
jgi:hypothetical protein